jgi:RimJ/RimL family protein N-acetyltransferase
MVVHVAESGREGSPHFTISRTLNREEMREAVHARWMRSLDEPLWGRTWLLIHPAGRRVVGHVELRGGRMPAELHRALLGMGIERAFTAKGNGQRLIDTAIAWARETRRLSWIDLGVFANNIPARKLYARTGFVEAGLRRDAFHVDDGVTVDDITMTLRIA